MDREGSTPRSSRRGSPTRGRAVWIARHGNRLDFADPIWLRTAAYPYNPPLAPAGIAQARALGRRLRSQRVAHLFCSPFLRTLEAAHHIAAMLDLRVKVEPGLSEWLSPAWFPQAPLWSLDELGQRFPRIDRAYRARGGAHYGESGEAAEARCGATARRLVTDFSGDLLMVGHGVSVRGAVAGLLDIATAAIRPTLGSIPYGCVTKLQCEDTTWVIALASDTAHLRTVHHP